MKKIALIVIACVVAFFAPIGAVSILNEIAINAQHDRIEKALTEGMFKKSAENHEPTVIETKVYTYKIEK